MKKSEIKRLVAEYKKINLKIKIIENKKMLEKLKEIEHRYFHETGKILNRICKRLHKIYHKLTKNNEIQPYKV